MPLFKVWVWGALAALLVSACALSGALPAQQQRGQSISGGTTQAPAPTASADSGLPLFVVMAAINAAGYDADLDSPQNSPIRKQVRADVAAANPPSLTALRSFYTVHRNASPTRDLSQWISFALLLDGPPDFDFRVKEADLPAEVNALRDLRGMLADFYKEAHLDQLWRKYRPAYEAELSRYDEGLGQVTLQVNGYLRLGTSAFLGRDFSIFVDLLSAPNQTNARSFGRDYYVVMGPSARPQMEQVRHGYLHFVLEPMAGKYSSVIQTKADLKPIAADAAALDRTLKANFRLLLSESLIRAVELRMTSMAPGPKQARLNDILSEGLILAPYFYEALDVYEKQDIGMRLYYPDLVEKMDVRHEQKRLANVTFRAAASEPGIPKAGAQAADGTAAGAAGRGAAPQAATDELKLLAQGEDAMSRQDMARAQEFFKSAAGLKGPHQDRAVYGLALVAAQMGQPELAKTFFQQTIDLSRDPHVLAWANIYMGRISDMEQNRELAMKYYQQALKSGDNEPATIQAAQRGLSEPFRWEQRKSPANSNSKPEE